MFKCIIFHSSTKLLVPPLHKFIIGKFDLFFFLFFGKLNLLNIAVYLLTCQYFGRMKKKLSLRKVGLFCRLFIVQVKKVCYEKKVQGELLGISFHYTLKWLRPQVPSTNFRLMTLQNWVECQCYNATNIPPC